MKLDQLYAFNLRSAFVFAVLVAVGLTICHFGIVEDAVPMWQQQLIAGIGIAANIAIIYYHITVPPHPKFLLVGFRKLVVRLHAGFGVLEVLIGILAFFFEEARLPFAVLAILHSLTSYVQSPAVFGAKAIMVPAYFFASTLHIYCGTRLLFEPASHEWLMRTFLTLNIYAYVRMFMVLFERTGLFKDNHYSASVLFSGVPVLPAIMGPASIFYILPYIFLYPKLCKLVFGLSEEEEAHLWDEHVRVGLVNEQLKQSWVAQELGISEDDAKGRVHQEYARRIFHRLDGNSNGMLEKPELLRFFESWGISNGALEVMEANMPEHITFERFYHLLRSSNMMAKTIQRLQKEACENDDDKARLIFEELDFDGSGYIERVELEMLLLEYGLPRHEVREYLDRYDNNGDGRISFEEFRDHFRPLWQFAYNTVLA
jgi:Ca2+-binding EF-hand superfamily protein